MWHDSIYNLTPVENVGDIWFKRDDLFSPDGVHNGSKFRQLIWLFSRRAFPGVVSGAVKDSPQLSMVAACAQHYKMECVQFSGARKNMAEAGEKLGAKTILVNPGYGPLLNKRATRRRSGDVRISANAGEHISIAGRDLGELVFSRKSDAWSRLTSKSQKVEAAGVAVLINRRTQRDHLTVGARE